MILIACHFNSLKPRQNGRHFADNIFKCIFLNENIWILIKISLKFVHRGPINNIPALVRIMAWRQPGDKPLSEPMTVRLKMYIYVTRPQWVNHTLQVWLPHHWSQNTKSESFSIVITLQNSMWCINNMVHILEIPFRIAVFNIVLYLFAL